MARRGLTSRLRSLLARDDDRTKSYRDTFSNTSLDEGDGVNTIHVHKAVNGHVIELFGRPDKKNYDVRKQTLWIVPEGESVPDAVTRALVSAVVDK